MRQKSLLRENDELASMSVSDFLDEKFYSYTNNFQRIFDKERQFEGVDTIFTYNGFDYVCDEKAAIQYANKELMTFSMELSFIDKGNYLHDGWLLDEKKINNSFMFIWINESMNDVISNKDELLEVEIAIVKKDKIINYLNELGWGHDKLITKSNRIMENEHEFLGNIYNNGCKFSFSKKLVEKPVNILIRREKLRELSDINKTLVK